VRCRGESAPKLSLPYIPLSSVVLKFCNAYLMLKGVDFIFLSAYLMFLVVVFMCYCGYFLFSYLNNSHFFQNMIYNDLFIICSNQS
jgi:hypothetical protein